MYAEGTVVGGRYRLIKKIGEGGMATIWEAEHQTLGSPVAVKFLQWSGPQAEQMRERFLREARVAASVRHRNVVEITDFGITDDKTPYIVMERLQGESLADLLDRERRVEPVEAARIVSLALRGLAAVHERGIVHRDLKPENVFIVNDPDGSFPKLLDFGVSKRATPEKGGRDLTQEGILVGTPDYMSPEQARGLKDIDARTDIWSMGVILYEAISGRLPFETENVGDLIVMITTQQPTPITDHVPDLSPHLAEIVERALAKDRDERYATARDMRWAIIEAFRGADAFGDVASGVTSVSEMPPPPGMGTGSHPRILPQPTPSQPLRRPSSPLGAPPETPGPPMPRREDKPRTRGWMVGAAVAGLAALAAGVFLYVQAQARRGSDEEPPATATWKPATEGLPPGLLDPDGGPFHDAGETVRLRLYHVPDEGAAAVEGVLLGGAEARLPMAPFDYRVEVRGPDGGAVWGVSHPGSVDGEYEVYVVPDGGVAQEEPTKRRRPRRGGRRRPRRGR